MRRVLAPLGGAISFVIVALLVIGGLTWVTVESLNVESERRLATARADASQNERLALWRLDSRLFPAWGVENYRPYAHYFAFYSPCPVLIVDNFGVPIDPVPVPTPLLSDDLPDWMTLHFQLDSEYGWDSPQVLSPAGDAKLQGLLQELYPPRNYNEARSEALNALRAKFPAKAMHEQLMSFERELDDSPLAVPFYERDKQNAANQNLPEAVAGGNRGRGGVPGSDAANTGEKDAAAKRGLAGGGLRGGRLGAANADGAAAVPGDAPAAPAPAAAPPAVAGGRSMSPAQPGSGYDARLANSKNSLNELGAAREENIPNKPAEMPGPPAPPKAEAAEQAKKEAEKAADKKDAGKPQASAGPAERKNPEAQLRRGQEAKPAARQENAAPALLKKAADDDLTKNLKDHAAAGESKLALKFDPKKAFNPILRPPTVQLGPMRPVWLKGPNGDAALLLVRAARLETKTVFQGVLLDWPRLQNVLLEEVRPQLPEAKLEAVLDAADPTERRMTALPAALDPGAEPVPPAAGWTPLRIGLTLGWIAALLALAAVGFVGWTLIDLSERRIRFVSAVTHELRTPLTSLRLYLDLLSSGMIREEEQQREYLRTLGSESERLNRLIDNVLDFAKLEKNSVQAQCVPLPLSDLLEQIQQTWADRLASEGRELVVMSTLPPDQMLRTDARIAAQILGNLIDNARKYSGDAEEKRVWLWARPGEKNRIMLEVEDRGPGVPAAESAAIFRPFRRGANVHSTGGAGLGLALARQWADLLGGTLSYRPADGGVGACFRLSLPIQ